MERKREVGVERKRREKVFSVFLKVFSETCSFSKCVFLQRCPGTIALLAEDLFLTLCVYFPPVAALR